MLTFFSPSGYEIRKNYAGADLVYYLPIDTVANARRFIRLIKPSAAFFVKYEFWFNYLRTLKANNIPTYLVSGIFRKNQYFFKPHGSWALGQLNAFTHFFVQDETSKGLLSAEGFNNVTVSGDTRFDRVAEIAGTTKELPLAEEFSVGKKVLVAGSTWKEDEELLGAIHLEKYKLIIAPHEISEDRITHIESLFEGKSIRYSNAANQDLSKVSVLIIDNIGMLSSLYRYGRIALIGGGFGKGIHNILEASAFGVPVIIGPEYNKFREATDLVRTGGAFEVRNSQDLQNVISLLEDDEVYKTASHISSHYVKAKRGATDIILKGISLKQQGFS